MRQCICQICVCGRHRCEHTSKRRIPFAKDDDTGEVTTEHKDRYQPFAFQPRQQPVKPLSGAEWRGDEPTVKLSTTKKDFVAFPIKKRSLMRPKVSKEPRGKMKDLNTTYQHDFGPKKGAPASKAKVPDPCQDGTMPGTLPGKIECSTTYNRCYTPKPCQKREKADKKECVLTELGQPFTGETETGLSYKRHPYQKREQILPNKGTLRAGGGDFLDTTTHKSDFTPKYLVPERPAKKVAKWKPSEGKFDSDTTHKHDYKYPPPTDRAVSCAPKPALPKVGGPFEGKSHYKQDYQPHQLTRRQLPKWHPSFRPFEPSTAPFEGETMYRTDYEPPPEDLPPHQPAKPLKSNLTLPKGPMEKLTTSMRDYRKIDRPIPIKSFKPDAKYQKPSGKFAGDTITSTDYTPKKSDKLQISKASDNLKPGKGLMEDMTMTMKDFQWLAIECPATYLKLFGKDALPNYKFEKREGGHDIFKKLKKPKAPKVNLTKYEQAREIVVK